MGRPSDFNKSVARLILEETENGKSLDEMCQDHPDLPSEATIRRWIENNLEGFRDNYARAKAAMAEHMAEEILAIADDGRNDWMTIQRGGVEVEVENHEVVNRSKLRIDTRKWLLSKLLPKKYGETIKQEHSGPDGGPLTISWLPKPPGGPSLV
jgi:hypothetical protein